MIDRIIAPHLKRLASQYPVVTITGPRQSGKTTLCRSLFPEKQYVSLEDPDQRRLANSDPREFLDRVRKGGAILDEIQKAPELVSYIQGIVDEDDILGQFILTGSEQFELTGAISQSLAGRTALLRLLPFSYEELYGESGQDQVDDCLYKGFYPRIHDKDLNPTEALSFYVNTYIERDVRSIKNIVNLSQFESFLRLCASNVGQELNKSRLGNDLGIDLKTVTSWLSVLEASYVIFLLQPHFKNFRKRVTKSPKIYFYDVGLASYLLGVSESGQLQNHPMRGYLFENFIISELVKSRFNGVKDNNLYFYRDNKGTEVDVIIDNGANYTAIEIKSSKTYSDHFLKGLQTYSKINPDVSANFIVYGGETRQIISSTELLPYFNLGVID